MSDKWSAGGDRDGQDLPEGAPPPADAARPWSGGPPAGPAATSGPPAAQPTAADGPPPGGAGPGGGPSGGSGVLPRGLLSGNVLPLMIGAGVASLIVLVAAVAWLTRSEGSPELPFVPIARVDAVAEPVLDRDRDIFFVPTREGIRAFDAAGLDLVYCEGSGNLESADGRVWSTTGQPLRAEQPLPEYPLEIYEDFMYVNLQTTHPAAGGAGGAGGGSAAPACTGEG